MAVVHRKGGNNDDYSKNMVVVLWFDSGQSIWLELGP